MPMEVKKTTTYNITTKQPTN